VGPKDDYSFIYHTTSREYSAITGLSTDCITAVQTTDMSFFLGGMYGAFLRQKIRHSVGLTVRLHLLPSCVELSLHFPTRFHTVVFDRVL
jgi:hypothetical protein